MSFKKWKDYFTANQDHIDWYIPSATPELNDAERNLIYKTIQQFQKGENSEGKNLMRYSKQMLDSDYTEAIKLFIREEQNHAMALGKFMEAEGIPKIREHWIDGVFRGLRKMAGLELSVAVLLTAEVIAAVFYKALMKATASESLAKICRQLLKDEDMHLQFQSYALGILHGRNNLLMKVFYRIFRNILMRGTIIVVWLTQHKVLAAGDYSFALFYNETMRVFTSTEQMMLAISQRESAVPGQYSI